MIFQARAPRPDFPARVPSKQVGDVFRGIWDLLASNMHVEMGKPLYNQWDQNIVGFSSCWGMILAALRGEHLFVKCTQKKTTLIVDRFLVN